jgi:ATP-dependent helicase/nuclease subunit A
MKSNFQQTLNLQQIASNPKNSAWVFASAGSGKTKILTDRVLRLLLDNVSPNKILCLTFTKVAAAEMQSRINSELAKWILCDNAELQKKLTALSGDFPTENELKRARILFVKILDEESKIKVQTIHSFCQTLIKIFPFEAKVKPNFEVLESNQEKLLLKTAQKEVLKKALVNEELKNLVQETNAKLHEESFSGLVANLLNKKEQLNSLKEKFFGIENIIAKIFKNFGVSNEGSSSKQILKQVQDDDVGNDLDEDVGNDLDEDVGNDLDDDVGNDLDEDVGNDLDEDVGNDLDDDAVNVQHQTQPSLRHPELVSGSIIFQKFAAQINHQAHLKLALELENSGLVTNSKLATAIRKFLNNLILENFPDYKLAFFTQEGNPRKLSKNIAANLELTSIFSDCCQLINNFSDQLNSLKIANDSALLLRFVDHILENYSQLKKQNSVLDYNDLIVETNRLLANPDFSNWVKLKMDSSFDHILIDESQDTNHQQWNIIKALSEDFFTGLSSSNKSRSIFIVGDEKQSIYSFQGAEPNISAEIFAHFAEKLGSNLKKIELNNSFRSQAKILQAVDDVFSKEERKKAISKVSEFQAHKPIREGLGKVEIWPQIQKEKTEKKEISFEWKIDFSKDEEQEEGEILAEIIARKIHLRVDSKLANYGDFMILLRNRTNGFDKALAKFFHQYQIPFTSVSKIKFSENILIQDLLAAAKFVLLPHDDLNLACLLKSPIFAISEEELFEICQFKNEHETTIFNSLGQLEKFREIKNNLDELITKSQQLNCFEFFYFLLHQKNHQQNFLATFGHENLEILDKLLLSVFDFCQNFSPNLQKYLEFIEKLDFEISLSSDENDRVKITTIHSAKGLQAKIVMIPDCSYNFNQLLSAKEEISWIEFGEDKIPVWCRKKEDENLLLKKHRACKLLEAKEEYLRLLYVAMTRAENELYVGSFGKAKDPECWYEIVKNSVTGAEILELGEFLKMAEIEDSSARKIPKQVRDDAEKEVSLSLKFSHRHPELDSGSIAQNQIKPSQIKGRLVHKIFEVIGKNSAEDKNWLQEIAKKIIEKEEFLSEREKNKIQQDLAAFIDSQHFEKLFSGKVRCEVDIVGQKNLKRIDLLVEKENEVLIVDYKSDEILPDVVPDQYLRQLNGYKKLVEGIYAGKEIKIAIFWTGFLQLNIL